MLLLLLLIVKSDEFLRNVRYARALSKMDQWEIISEVVKDNIDLSKECLDKLIEEIEKLAQEIVSLSESEISKNALDTKINSLEVNY
mgnify:CR=1 FL=1